MKRNLYKRRRLVYKVIEMPKTWKEMTEKERQALRKRLDERGIPRLTRHGAMKKHHYKSYRKRRLLELEAKRWVWKQLGNKCENCPESNESTFDMHHDEERDTTQPRMREILKWYKEQKIPDNVHLYCANCHRKLKHPLIRRGDLS